MLTHKILIALALLILTLTPMGYQPVLATTILDSEGDEQEGSLEMAEHSLEGTVNFSTRFHIQTIASGTVVQVNAKVGDRVDAGSVLIELDSTRQQASVQMAENRVAKLQIAYEDADARFARQQELFERGSLSVLLYQKAENDLKLAQLDLSSAKARLASVRHELASRHMTAPFAAIVVGSTVHPGMNVHPVYEWLRMLPDTEPPLMTLGSAGRYIVEDFVTLQTWYQLNSADSVSVQVNGQTYAVTAVLSALDPRDTHHHYDHDSPLYPVKFEFIDSDRLILPGTPASVLLN